METITDLLLIVIMSLAVYGLFVSIRQGKRAEKRGIDMLKIIKGEMDWDKEEEEEEEEKAKDDNGLPTEKSH